MHVIKIFQANQAARAFKGMRCMDTRGKTIGVLGAGGIGEEAPTRGRSGWTGRQERAKHPWTYRYARGDTLKCSRTLCNA